MTTQRQIESNRRNSSRSTGPTSAPGKQASSRNALDHGLSGTGRVLPAAQEAQLAVRVAELTETYRPSNEQERLFVEAIAVESARLERCQRQQHRLRVVRSDLARHCWANDRRHEAEILFLKLHKSPRVVLHGLASTAQGCDLLIDRWVILAAALDDGRTWTEDQRRQALDLLGVPPEFRDGDDPFEPTCENGETETESESEAQARVAAGEIALFRQWKEDFLDRMDAEAQVATVYGDAPPDREYWRMLRYEIAATRRLERALDYFHKAPAARPAPASAPAPAPSRPRPQPTPPVSPSIASPPPPAKLTLDVSILAKTVNHPPSAVPALAVPGSEPRGNRRSRKAQAKRARQAVG